MTDCIFCKIINGDVPCKKVYDDEGYLAFEDIKPASPVHILVVPKKHIASIAESKAEDQAILGGLLLTTKKVAEKMNLTDYRLVINNGREVGQSVFHIHVHVMGGRTFRWPPG